MHSISDKESVVVWYFPGWADTHTDAACHTAQMAKKTFIYCKFIILMLFYPKQVIYSQGVPWAVLVLLIFLSLITDNSQVLSLTKVTPLFIYIIGSCRITLGYIFISLPTDN